MLQEKGGMENQSNVEKIEDEKGPDLDETIEPEHDETIETAHEDDSGIVDEGNSEKGDGIPNDEDA